MDEDVPKIKINNDFQTADQMDRQSKFKRSLVEAGDEVSKEFGSFRLPKKGSDIADSDFKNM